jgi:adenine phosphoribosyltransferase
MNDYLQLIGRGDGSRRCDVTPLFESHAAFTALIEDLVRPYLAVGVDQVAGIDALGFVLGTATALRLKVGFVALRKSGKLPSGTYTQPLTDYSGSPKALEVRVGAIPSGSKVLLVDEWVETGAQVEAAVALVERSGGVVVGICAINIDDNERTRALRERYLLTSPARACR